MTGAIIFTINGERHELLSCDPSTTLVQYIREKTTFKGTKVACGEGGCGSCAVLVSRYDTQTRAVEERTLNACLAPVCSLDGCAVTTTEGLGSSRSAKGLHAVHKRLAGFHASQCGFCTPGMAVSLYASLRKARGGQATAPHPVGVTDGVSNGAPCDENGGEDALTALRSLTQAAAEEAIGGNLRRCTGYRPILDACKSFAGAGLDVEDLGLSAFCKGDGRTQREVLPIYDAGDDPAFPDFLVRELEARASSQADASMAGNGHLATSEGVKTWHAPGSLAEVWRLLEEAASPDQVSSPVKLLCGNTMGGVYKDLPRPLVCISLSKIAELRQVTRSPEGVRVGAAISLAELIEVLAAAPSLTPPGKAQRQGPARSSAGEASPVFVELAEHLRQVATPHVRNAASVAGNLIMAQQRGFESDVATILLGVGASITISSKSSKSSPMPLGDFFLRDKLAPLEVVESITIPSWAPIETAIEFATKVGGFHVKDGEASPEHRGLRAICRTYRAAPRPRGNAHAFAIGAFVAILGPAPAPGGHSSANGIGAANGRQDGEEEGATVVRYVQLAFGAIGRKHPMRARRAEAFLTNRELTAGVLLEALAVLREELQPPPGTRKAEYRVSAAAGFLFAFLAPHAPRLSPPPQSAPAASPLRKDGGVTRGHQKFAFPKEHFPVSEPVPKLGAELQASGEAVYVDDIPSPPGCLHAAFVMSSVALAKVVGVDPTEALRLPGVTAFLSEKDVPAGGQNLSLSYGSPPLSDSLFAGDTVEFVGHPVGLVVADSYAHAKEAAAKVAISYDTQSAGSPILTLDDAVARSSFIPLPGFDRSKPSRGDAAKALREAVHKIEGAEASCGTQMHFYLEPNTALAVPDEGGTLTVYSSNQSPEMVQSSIAKCLGVRQHAVRVVTRRLGGAFGAKATRAALIAVACALAAFKLGRPVRMALDRNTDMAITAGRSEAKAKYDVGFDSDGRITALQMDVVLNAGVTKDLSIVSAMMLPTAACRYGWGAFHIDLKLCRTNLPTRTTMRAPGEVQGTFLAETVIEHVAAVLGLDPHVVRERNQLDMAALADFYKDGAPAQPSQYTLPRIWEGLKASARYEERAAAADEFNRASPWRKRGLAMTPVVYKVPMLVKPGRVSVHADGSVVVEEGGVEMGQGLWTKVRQTVAYGLGRLWEDDGADAGGEGAARREGGANGAAAHDRVPNGGVDMDKIRIIDQDSLSLPNGAISGASTTSEASCEAVRRACEVLVARLRPVREEVEKESAEKGRPATASWEDVIAKARSRDMDLSAQGFFSGKASGGGPISYLNFGAAVSEVEVDVLTGATTILRSDICYDCGKSLNPGIDIGQVEGAFVQGIGYLFEETIISDEGKLVSDGTWEYKIPSYDTIPRELNVELLHSSGNSKGILSSKASGEPPLLLAFSVHAAIRHAVRAARSACAALPPVAGDRVAGQRSERGGEAFFRMDNLATMDRVQALCGHDFVDRYLASMATVEGKGQ